MNEDIDIGLEVGNHTLLGMGLDIGNEAFAMLYVSFITTTLKNMAVSFEN